MANGGLNITHLINPRDGIPRTGDRSNYNTSESAIVQLVFVVISPTTTDLGTTMWVFHGVPPAMSKTYQTFNRQRTEMAANGLGAQIVLLTVWVILIGRVS